MLKTKISSLKMKFLNTVLVEFNIYYTGHYRINQWYINIEYILISILNNKNFNLFSVGMSSAGVCMSPQSSFECPCSMQFDSRMDGSDSCNYFSNEQDDDHNYNNIRNIVNIKLIFYTI